MFYLFDVTANTKRYGSIPSGKDLLKNNVPWETEEDAESSLRGPMERLLNIDEAIQSVGIGIFQYRILIAAGLLLAADSMEMVIVSFLSNVVTRYHWNHGTSSRLADPDTIGLIVFPAVLIGALVWGILGDIVGRRIVFASTAATIAVFGMGTAFVSSYGGLLAARFMVAFGIGGVTVPFCTFSEFLPPSHRGTHLLLVQLFFAIGALVVHLALKHQHPEFWRQIVALCSIPGMLSTILGLTVVPESPRWLLAKDRQEEAIEVLRQAARANGKDPSALFPEGLILYSHEPQDSFAGVFNLCSSGWIKLSSALWTTCFGLSFLDHGTVALAVSVFSNDDRQQDYQAIFNAASEGLGLLIVLFTINTWGRVMTQCLAFASSGIICLALALLEDYDSSVSPNLLLLLAFLAHMFTFGGTCATLISTTEILSTDMRTTGHATANVFGLLGGSLSSDVLTRIYSLPAIGLVLFVVSLWTASASSALPETAAKEMGVVHHPTLNRRRIC